METLYHILLWGGLVTLVCFVIAIGAYLIDPKIFGRDLGWDEAHQNVKGGVLTGVGMLLTSIFIMVYAASNYEYIDGGVGFGKALWISYLIFQVFNWADFFILDWLIYMKIKPAFMRPEQLPVADNISRHFKDSVKGLFIGILPALISTAIWVLLRT